MCPTVLQQTLGIDVIHGETAYLQFPQLPYGQRQPKNTVRMMEKHLFL